MRPADPALLDRDLATEPPVEAPTLNNQRGDVRPAGGSDRLRGIVSAAVAFAILSLAALPILLPLFAPGYVIGHDAVDPPWRSLELSLALSQGVIWPRWVPDLFCGYGFPIFNFYSPLSFYPAALLNAFAQMSLLDGTKIAFGLDLLLSGIGAYLLARQAIGNRWASILAGVLYMYAPATVGTVYVRSALATSAALAAFPFCMAALLRLCQAPSLGLAGLAAIAVALFALTHNITVLQGFGIIGFVLTVHYWRNRDLAGLKLVILALVLGFGMASFFWIPALQELKLTYNEDLTTGYSDFHLHMVDPLGDISPELVGPAIKVTRLGPLDLHPVYPYGDPPYKLGLLQGVLWLVSVGVLLRSRRRPLIVLSLSLVSLLLFYMTTTWSMWIWELIPALALIQHPWRIYGPMGLCLAILSSWALLQLESRSLGRLLMMAIGVAAVATAVLALHSVMRPFGPGSEITTASMLRWEGASRWRLGTLVGGQFLPRSVDWDRAGMGLDSIVDRYGETFPAEQYAGGTAFLSKGSNAWINATRRGTQWMEAAIEASEQTRVAFHTIYFAGWTAYIDGNKVPIEYATWYQYEENRRATLGVCSVDVPPGRHLVRLVFEDTPIRALSNALSAISVLAVGIAFLTAYWLGRGRKRGSAKRLAILILGWITFAFVVYGAYLGFVASRAPDWVDHRIVRNFLFEAANHRLDVVVPDGQKPENFVLSKDFTIQGDGRSVLYMHPSASASTKVWLPEGARIEFATGIDPAVWDKEGDGVDFEITVVEGERRTTVYKQYIDPKNRPADRKWMENVVDLSSFAHKQVEVVLSTSPGATNAYDWAGWANPRITAPGSPRN